MNKCAVRFSAGSQLIRDRRAVTVKTIAFFLVALLANGKLNDRLNSCHLPMSLSTKRQNDYSHKQKTKTYRRQSVELSMWMSAITIALLLLHLAAAQPPGTANIIVQPRRYVGYCTECQ